MGAGRWVKGESESGDIWTARVTLVDRQQTNSSLYFSDAGERKTEGMISEREERGESRDWPEGRIGLSQCCGSGSGIRYLFDPWIPGPTIISENLKPIFSWVKK
jgi:hypothetical protein